MKYVSKEYEKTLLDLAETLVNPNRYTLGLCAADLALDDTIEFEPIRSDKA